MTPSSILADKPKDMRIEDNTAFPYGKYVLGYKVPCVLVRHIKLLNKMA